MEEELELAHFNKPELDVLDRMQGKQEKINGIRVYSKLSHLMEDPDLEEQIHRDHQEHMENGGHELHHKLHDMAKDGRFGDTEIAYISKPLMHRLDRSIGGPSINPRDGKHEYFLGTMLESMSKYLNPAMERIGTGATNAYRKYIYKPIVKPFVSTPLGNKINQLSNYADRNPAFVNKVEYALNTPSRLKNSISDSFEQYMSGNPERDYVNRLPNNYGMTHAQQRARGEQWGPLLERLKETKRQNDSLRGGTFNPRMQEAIERIPPHPAFQTAADQRALRLNAALERARNAAEQARLNPPMPIDNPNVRVTDPLRNHAVLPRREYLRQHILPADMGGTGEPVFNFNPLEMGGTGEPIYPLENMPRQRRRVTFQD
jgi:hypothetical protein